MPFALCVAAVTALSGCRLLYDTEPESGRPTVPGCTGDGCADACADLVGSQAFVSARNGHCYVLQETLLRWDRATDSCHGEGTHPVTFESREELDDVVANLAFGSDVWIGMFNQNGTLQWDTNESILFSNWQSGQPPADVGGMAVAMATDGTWFTTTQTTNYASICERSLAQTADGAVFAKFDQSVTWDVARVDCEQRGGNLATVLSAEAAAAALPLTASNAWIGLSDQATEGAFEWVTGAPLDFTQWAPTRPDGDTGENCVEALDGQWDDHLCSDDRRYICEFRAP